MQRERAEAYHDNDDSWHLPIGHRVEDSLETEGLNMASTGTAIPEDNKGFQMLRKMGWKGAGLGRDERGQHILWL